MHPHEPALFTAYLNNQSRPAPVQGPTYTRPLRSWSLALRANDKRIDPDCSSPIVDYQEWDENSPQCAIEEVTLDASKVKKLCATVMIPFPGVSIDEAARRFGVNRTTIFRWSRKTDSPLIIDYYCKRNGRDRHRADKYAWTRSPVDPAGEVWTVPWDECRPDLTLTIPDDFSQILLRAHRPLASRVYSRFLQCPTCQSWNYKLFMPQRVWTVGDEIGRTRKSRDAEMELFLCRKCAKLIYESAERGSRPAPGRGVNIWDRYVKRATDGILRGSDVKLYESL